MTGNALRNATFLDGSDGWAAGAVDESVRGAPGRIALTNAGVVQSTSGAMVLANRRMEASVLAYATGGVPTVEVVIGGTTVPVPLEEAGDGTGRRGLPSTFHVFRYRGLAPATGTAQLRVTGSGGVTITKPFLDGDAPADGCQPFGVGPHASPDLNMPAWPPELPLPVDADTQPAPMRAGYMSDAQVPMMRRLTSRPQALHTVTFRLDAIQRDALQRFLEERKTPFWYVRHDTQQVVRARWHPNGDPVDRGTGKSRTTTCGLQIEVV